MLTFAMVRDTVMPGLRREGPLPHIVVIVSPHPEDLAVMIRFEDRVIAAVREREEAIALLRSYGDQIGTLLVAEGSLRASFEIIRDLETAGVLAATVNRLVVATGASDDYVVMQDGKAPMCGLQCVHVLFPPYDLFSVRMFMSAAQRGVYPTKASHGDALTA